MKKNLFVLTAVAVLSAACATAPKTAQQLNDDYTGTFFGVLPCADCSGIETEVTLQPGGSYKIGEVYENKTAASFDSSGKWTPAPDLKYVELTDSKTSAKTYYAFDGKDALKKLDASAQPIKSDLNYTLTRKVFDFASITGKEWQLAQVKDSAGKVTFDAAKQTSEFLKGIFTLQFDNGRAFGKASPNRYTGPYTLGKDNKITFGPAASTLMMGIVEPVGLSEHQYFQLMAKVYAWNYVNGSLVLYTLDEAGGNISMKFDKVN